MKRGRSRRWLAAGIGKVCSVLRPVIAQPLVPDNRAALGLVHDIAPDASVRWRDGAYRVIVPLAGIC
jgi:hypothetical protein